MIQFSWAFSDVGVKSSYMAAQFYENITNFKRQLNTDNLQESIF